MAKRFRININPRQGGKSEMMRKAMDKFLDENPSARVCVASSKGIEFIENAEFEVIKTQKQNDGKEENR